MRQICLRDIGGGPITSNQIPTALEKSALPKFNSPGASHENLEKKKKLGTIILSDGRCVAAW